jgi:hypothetical protein
MKFGASGLRGLSVDLRGRASVLYAAAFGRHLLEIGKPANGAAILIECDFGDSRPSTSANCANASLNWDLLLSTTGPFLHQRSPVPDGDRFA